MVHGYSYLFGQKAKAVRVDKDSAARDVNNTRTGNYNVKGKVTVVNRKQTTCRVEAFGENLIDEFLNSRVIAVTLEIS